MTTIDKAVVRLPILLNELDAMLEELTDLYAKRDHLEAGGDSESVSWRIVQRRLATTGRMIDILAAELNAMEEERAAWEAANRPIEWPESP